MKSRFAFFTRNSRGGTGLNGQKSSRRVLMRLLTRASSHCSLARRERGRPSDRYSVNPLVLESFKDFEALKRRPQVRQ